MKKNDNINVVINNYGCNAEGVARFDGKTVFVPYSLVGENVDATIIKDNSTFCIGKITNIKNKSKERVEPVCPYFAKCGGCNLQHTNYQNSLDIKTQIVQNAITNIGKIDYTIPKTKPSPKQYHYRNKVAFPINPKTRKVGMYRLSSHKIVDIDNCPLQKDLINNLIETMNQYLAKTKNTIYDDDTKKGLLKTVVAREIDNKLLITLVINGKELLDKNQFVEIISQNFDNVGISLNINQLNNNVILTDKFENIYGNNEIELEEFGIKYKINNQSFLQVNDEVKREMYQKIFDEIDGSVVVDAYSGAGLLSAMMAKHAKQVFGIEIIEEATKLADKLKEQNNIQNLTNINGNCAEELPKLLESIKNSGNQNFGNTQNNDEKQNNDLIVVLDPPRKGCDKKVLDSILSVSPAKIVYMSCDPSTLARDLKILLDSNNYSIKYIEPYDMFPQTKHVETLAVLTRK